MSTYRHILSLHVRITKEKQILTLFVLQCSLSSASEFHSKKDSHRECSVQHRQLRRQSMMGGTKWLLDNSQDPVQLEKDYILDLHQCPRLPKPTHYTHHPSAMQLQTWNPVNMKNALPDAPRKRQELDYDPKSTLQELLLKRPGIKCTIHGWPQLDPISPEYKKHQCGNYSK